MKVVYAPRALRDLRHCCLSLGTHSSGAANVLTAIKSSIDTLSFFPQIGRLVDEAGHRRVPVVRYRISGDELFILHIRHTSRQPLDPSTEL